jgi:hypothetical protein
MRLQTGAPPRFADEIVVNLQQATEFAGTPVGTAVWRRLPRLVQHPGLHRRRQDGRRLPPVLWRQALQPLLKKTPTPSVDVVPVARHRRFDHRVRRPIRQHQDHPRATRVFRTDLETTQAAFEFGSLISSQHQRHMPQQGTSTPSVSTSH